MWWLAHLLAADEVAGICLCFFCTALSGFRLLARKPAIPAASAPCTDSASSVLMTSTFFTSVAQAGSLQSASSVRKTACLSQSASQAGSSQSAGLARFYRRRMASVCISVCANKAQQHPSASPLFPTASTCSMQLPNMFSNPRANQQVRCHATTHLAFVGPTCAAQSQQPPDIAADMHRLKPHVVQDQSSALQPEVTWFQSAQQNAKRCAHRSWDCCKYRTCNFGQLNNAANAGYACHPIQAATPLRQLKAQHGPRLSASQQQARAHHTTSAAVLLHEPTASYGTMLLAAPHQSTTQRGTTALAPAHQTRSQHVSSIIAPRHSAATVVEQPIETPLDQAQAWDGDPSTFIQYARALSTPEQLHDAVMQLGPGISAVNLASAFLRLAQMKAVGDRIDRHVTRLNPAEELCYNFLVGLLLKPVPLEAAQLNDVINAQPMPSVPRYQMCNSKALAIIFFSLKHLGRKDYEVIQPLAAELLAGGAKKFMECTPKQASACMWMVGLSELALPPFWDAAAKVILEKFDSGEVPPTPMDWAYAMGALGRAGQYHQPVYEAFAVHVAHREAMKGAGIFAWTEVLNSYAEVRHIDEPVVKAALQGITDTLCFTRYIENPGTLGLLLEALAKLGVGLPSPVPASAQLPAASQDAPKDGVPGQDTVDIGSLIHIFLDKCCDVLIETVVKMDELAATKMLLALACMNAIEAQPKLTQAVVTRLNEVFNGNRFTMADIGLAALYMKKLQEVTGRQILTEPLRSDIAEVCQLTLCRREEDNVIARTNQYKRVEDVARALTSDVEGSKVLTIRRGYAIPEYGGALSADILVEMRDGSKLALLVLADPGSFMRNILRWTVGSDRIRMQLLQWAFGSNKLVDVRKWNLAGLIPKPDQLSLLAVNQRAFLEHLGLVETARIVDPRYAAVQGGPLLDNTLDIDDYES